jgi:AGZA family xanthine/uracil permease-like MFS transporter
VTYQGMAALGAGAILVGMILAAIVAYIIDKNYRAAIGYAIFGAACSWFGVIHASQFQLLPNASASTFSLAFGPPIGYLAIAGICLGMFFYTRNQPGAAPEEAAVAAE